MIFGWVITGRIPYHDIAHDVLVIVELISGSIR